MDTYTKIINWLLWKIVYFFKSKTIIIHTNGKPYLMRCVLKNVGKFPGIYLHHFLASDQDRDMHNHPFKMSHSLILSGEYIEKRLANDKRNINVKICYPGVVNKITSEDFHQVTLFKEPVWTLFFAKNRFQNWGFWSIEQQTFTPWNEYVELHNNFVTDLDGNRRGLYE